MVLVQLASFPSEESHFTFFNLVYVVACFNICAFLSVRR